MQGNYTKNFILLRVVLLLWGAITWGVMGLVLPVFALPVESQFYAQEEKPKPDEESTKTEEEEEEEEQLQRLNSQQRLQFLIQKGNELFDKRDFAKAENVFRKILEIRKNDPIWHYKLGNALAAQRKFEEAVVEYQEAIRLNSDYAVAYNALGSVRAEQGRWEAAATEYGRATEINPNYPDALYNLGVALWKQGKVNEAIPPLEKAKILFKDRGRFAELRQVEKLLEQVYKDKQEVS
ncbi:MAG TPA: tetratricopeptide repeat protein [Halomicronema sp.]